MTGQAPYGRNRGVKNPLTMKFPAFALLPVVDTYYTLDRDLRGALSEASLAVIPPARHR